MSRTGYIRLRPRSNTIYLSQNRSVLATGRDGMISAGSEHGFFVCETRLVSLLQYEIDGRCPFPVALSNVEQHTWLGYYITVPPRIEEEKLDSGSGMLQEASQQTLELKVSRSIGYGLHEDLDLTNFTQQKTSFEFSIELDADFAALEEIYRRKVQQGRIQRKWRKIDSTSGKLIFDYRATHRYSHQGNRGNARLHRALTVRIKNSDSPPIRRGKKFIFRIQLGPHEKWHTCLEYIPLMEDAVFPVLYPCRAFDGIYNELDSRRTIFLNESTHFEIPAGETLSGVVNGALEQAKKDLASLRLYDLDVDERSWVMAAGLPTYVALFGRDTLTVSWQSALLGTEMMIGTLVRLARLQGKSDNAWRDEQPGKMLHEAHTGPLEALCFNPRSRYYGSITTSGFYSFVLSELWHWTGNKDLVRPLVQPALRALKWLGRDSDEDRDGFYEYRTRSSQGVTNQGWKDSGDAIVYEDGSQVKAPIAVCEEQGYVYLAKLHLSETLWWLDQKEEAKRLYHEAEELKKRFNEHFWMEDEKFIAMGLDSQKRQIKSIGSNAGHCLGTAILNDESRVLAVADRMMADDLFSGWGIRTLSSNHPAYNPYSYHRGSIWPVEQGAFAFSFFRYGLYEQVERLCRAQFEAAALFDSYRLPELFAGHPRNPDHPFPGLYPQANSPQAWSSSAIFCFLQALLGIYAYAPLHVLFIDPHLPEWLPEITVENLRVGKATTTIRFFRKKNGKSDYRVRDLRGSLHIIRQPSPWSLTTSYAARVKDLITSLI